LLFSTNSPRSILLNTLFFAYSDLIGLYIYCFFSAHISSQIFWQMLSFMYFLFLVASAARYFYIFFFFTFVATEQKNQLYYFYERGLVLIYLTKKVPGASGICYKRRKKF